MYNCQTNKASNSPLAYNSFTFEHPPINLFLIKTNGIVSYFKKDINDFLSSSYF